MTYFNFNNTDRSKVRFSNLLMGIIEQMWLQYKNVQHFIIFVHWSEVSPQFSCVDFLSNYTFFPPLMLSALYMWCVQGDLLGTDRDNTFYILMVFCLCALKPVTFTMKKKILCFSYSSFHYYVIIFFLLHKCIFLSAPNLTSR